MAATMRDIIREELAASLEPVNRCLEELKSKLTTCDGKVTDLERAAVDTDVRLSELERNQQQIMEENDYLRMKITQLENHSRKFNIRILDLPLGVEAGNPTAFTTKLLKDLFGEETVGTGPLLSVAHRTGPVAVGKGSRCMIARLYSLEIKRKITKKAAEARSFMFNGTKIRIHSDISAETQSLRAEYRDVRAELFKRNIRCGFIHPTATLIMTFREKVHKFTTAREAQDFFARHIERGDQDEPVNGEEDKDEDEAEPGEENKDEDEAEPGEVASEMGEGQ